ncbi:hypothetical protein GW17_00025051 [Ensete ventricosum]|nr:hypothetical protein GW17_00025051 [Ensete ventricosum]
MNTAPLTSNLQRLHALTRVCTTTDDFVAAAMADVLRDHIVGGVCDIIDSESVERRRQPYKAAAVRWPATNGLSQPWLPRAERGHASDGRKGDGDDEREG